ncbi:hypothetical protein X801_05728, partial [Opisthorchis viverrini]
MLQCGIIRPSNKTGASSPYTVQAESATDYRLCGDRRALNDANTADR